MVEKRVRGDGGISKRRDGRWEGRYNVLTEDGYRRKSVYGRTEGEVREKLLRLAQRKDEVLPSTPPKLTFAKFLVQYEDVVRHTMKRRSFDTYEEVARLHLLPALGRINLRSLRRERIQRLYSEKMASGLSAARVRRIHGVLSSVLGYALKWRLVDYNVCREVTPPRVPAPEIRAFDSDEARRFLEAAKEDRFYALYVLGMTTGMRSGELGGLFWSDLDLLGRCVRVQRALITGRSGQSFEAPKTSNSRRTIGLTPMAIEVLEEHREQQKSEGFAGSSVSRDHLVFTNTVGGATNPSHLFCRSFKSILKRAGLPKTTFHAATRHTFCCLALQQGVNAKTVSLAMGHSSVAFTLQKYASFVPSHEDTSIALDKVLGDQARSR